MGIFGKLFSGGSNSDFKFDYMKKIVIIMGLFGKLFGGQPERKENTPPINHQVNTLKVTSPDSDWRSLASQKDLACSKCGKKPLLIKEDVIPNLTISTNNIFEAKEIASGHIPVDLKIHWRGKDYTQAELQNLVNKTIYERAGKCSGCGKILCVGCVAAYGNVLPNGKKGCPYCGSEMLIL